MDAYLQARVKANDFSGAVLVARKGKILLSRGYGEANREWKVPNGPTTRFRIGSITKQFIDRRQMEEGMKRDSDWILSVSDETAVKIECLELKGKQAVLVMAQHFVRTVPDRKDGSPHELVTNVKHRETWVYAKAGWMTMRIDELVQGAIYLDGKLYER